MKKENIDLLKDLTTEERRILKKVIKTKLNELGNIKISAGLLCDYLRDNQDLVNKIQHVVDYVKDNHLFNKVYNNSSIKIIQLGCCECGFADSYCWFSTKTNKEILESLDFRGIENDMCFICRVKKGLVVADYDFNTTNNNTKIDAWNYRSFIPQKTKSDTDDAYYLGYEQEIEIDDDISIDEVRDAIHAHTDFLIHNDSSLENGLEFCSQPKTIKKWLDDYDKIKRMNEFLSQCYDNNKDNAGFHVHFSRNAIKIDEDEFIARLDLLLNLYENEFVEISDRSTNRLNEWSPIRPVEKSTKELNIEKLKNKHHTGKYNAINTCHSNTIEIRLFDGTCDVNTIYARLQLVDNLINACNLSIDDFMKLSLKDIIEYNKNYTQCINKYNYLSEYECYNTSTPINKMLYNIKIEEEKIFIQLKKDYKMYLRIQNKVARVFDDTIKYVSFYSSYNACSPLSVQNASSKFRLCKELYGKLNTLSNACRKYQQQNVSGNSYPYYNEKILNEILKNIKTINTLKIKLDKEFKGGV